MSSKYSVVIPTLNRSESLCRALDSVFRQPIDGPLEVVVVDNCSEDNTQQVLAEPQYSSVRVIRQSARVPRIQNFMTALRAATGDYVAILYDDEEMLADNLLRKGKVLDKNPAVIAVTSSVAKRDIDGNLTPGVLVRPGFTIEARHEYLHNTFYKAPGGMPQVLMRREEAIEHLEIDPRDEPLDDNAFVMRLSTLGSIATLPECLVTETVTDAEMVRTGLLERFPVPGTDQVASLPAIWFGWSHYRIRVEHLLKSPDLSNRQVRSLHRAARIVFRRDVWKAAYWRWQVSRRPGPALSFLSRVGAFDLSLLIPPIWFFLRWKVSNTTAPMLSAASDSAEGSPEATRDLEAEVTSNQIRAI